MTVPADQELVRYVRPSTTGFTLIELLAVLFILALVAAIVVPSLGGNGLLELKSAARNLAAIPRGRWSYALFSLSNESSG